MLTFSNITDELATLPQILEEVKKYSEEYLHNLPTMTTYGQPVHSTLTLPEEGIGSLATLHHFDQRFRESLVASNGPRYWGFVTGGTTPAALAGDWLTSLYDQNPQSLTGAGDISANIEVETVGILRSLFGLPDTFQGGFVSGATMSNFTGLAVARQWAGKQTGRDIAREGISHDFIVAGATPHSSVIKALSMLGIGSNAIMRVNTLPGREALDVDALEEVLEQNPEKPVIFICSAGTVNTVDFDDISAIARLKEKYSFWLHIDAAFGGFAACTEEFNQLLDGWDCADSITIDFHKWLNVPYDSAAIFTRKEHAALQMQTFQNSNAAYLGDPEENFGFLNFLPDNSRRLRALPAWFNLVAYGRRGLKDMVEHSVANARRFAEVLTESPYFELLAPLRLNVVCFTLKNGDSQRFLKALNETGKVFMTPTVLFGQPGIRAAFVNYRTSFEDIDLVFREMETIAAQS